jgi:adhesin transport system outer membrane protein
MFMMRRRIRLAVLFALLVPGTGYAAESFDRLLKDALTTHPAVQGRQAGLEAARADREGAEWQMFPTPSFETAARSSGNSSGVLALEQPLWTGGRISAGIRAAGFRELAAEAAVVEAKQTMGLRVISAYTELLRQQYRQLYARSAVDQHDKLLALIGRRVQQEVSPPSDRDFAQTRLSQAATDLSFVIQGLQTAQAQLSQLAGRRVIDVEEVALSGRVLPATEAAALDRAVDRSPVLARLDQTALAANEDVASRKSALMPQLSVRVEKQVGFQPDNRALLVVRAQPGAGLSAASSIAAAQRRYDEARLAREEALRSLREQVQTVFAEWRAAQVRLESTRLSSDMAQAVFDSYTRQYVTGRKTWIDVLNAVREVTQTQFAVADAEALMRSSALRLWAITGEGPFGDPLPSGKP